ncbi:hypothetical protein HL658_00470 [Azospirillum sp. RWY-5-1]|uniref:ABC-type transport auxiliary lipoprotein component domain-containing protein n=1 Tax=Azospirillum oleiclasticum TaxID=2735135 RepID=A0ABX2T4W9_9PROT|nr:ABC-type transport auxiliary lipoprotein family protein [Azospirillum oleiclasticum]NYZ11006.1 hypothetical protein [Azospirillum oleiclasticum]NYZ18168.1 hypothetical protein [Azospirillum oleiclasticum]
MTVLTTDPRRRLARRTALGGFLALGAASAAGGCTALTPTPPALFTLTPKTTFEPGLPKANWQLLVELPVATAGLDTPRVAVIRNQTALDYFAEVSWTDRSPAMVQSLLIQSFEDSRRIVSVGRENVGLRSDFVLKTDLRDFQAEYSASNDRYPDRVHVRIVTKLVAMPRRTIEAGETFDAVEPIAGPGFPAVVAAFDEALGKVMKRVVEWTLRTGNAVKRASS